MPAESSLVFRIAWLGQSQFEWMRRCPKAVLVRYRLSRGAQNWRKLMLTNRRSRGAQNWKNDNNMLTNRCSRGVCCAPFLKECQALVRGRAAVRMLALAPVSSRGVCVRTAAALPKHVCMSMSFVASSTGSWKNKGCSAGGCFG